MTDSFSKIPYIELIGDPEENFYQLGLKDREEHFLVLDHMKGLVKTPWPILNKSFEEASKLVLKHALSVKNPFQSQFKAYCEGLGEPFQQIAYALLIPEIVSGMSKWVPGIPHNLLGCSSFFYQDADSKGPIHGRVLDFPLMGSYDINERAIHYKFKNFPEVFSYGTLGMPYPSITAMNSYGVTLALHQKFTNVLNHKGTPIFELAQKLIMECSNPSEVKEIIKKYPSITTWGIYMSFKSGEVLAIDVMGEDHYINEHQLEEGKVLYFCNKLEDKSMKQDNYLPHGIDNYNSMRTEIANKKIKKFEKQKNKSSLSFLKLISTPLEQKKVKPKKWNADCLTPSSIQICTLNPTLGESLYVSGDAPKFYRGSSDHFSDLWDGPIHELKKSKTGSSDLIFQKANKELMAAQIAHDKSNSHDIYHYLQMASSRMRGRPEEKIIHFFFLSFQYMYEENKKLRAHLLEEFVELTDSLPEYLNDHVILFIQRLEIILNQNITVFEKDIKNAQLKKVYKFESNLPRWLIHKTTSTLMNPRVDLLDIIYAHVTAH